MFPYLGDSYPEQSFATFVGILTLALITAGMLCYLGG